MPLDGTPENNPNLPVCLGCKNYIWEGETTVFIHFESDLDGLLGNTGVYHKECGRRFQSLANAINVMSRYLK